MREAIKHNSKLWSKEVQECRNDNDKGIWYLIWCPGCQCGHTIPNPRWGFDGKLENPTFTPSMKLYYTHPETKQDITICHFNITNGKIQYHGDCQHDLKGKTIDMVEIPNDYGFN